MKKKEIMTDIEILYQQDYFNYQEFFIKELGFDLNEGVILFISAIKGSPYGPIRGGGFCLKELTDVSNRLLREEIYVSKEDKCKRVVVLFNKFGIKKYRNKYEVSIDEVLEEIEDSKTLGNAEECIRLLRLQGDNKRADEIQRKYQYFLDNLNRLPEIQQKVLEEDKLEIERLKNISDTFEEKEDIEFFEDTDFED